MFMAFFVELCEQRQSVYHACRDGRNGQPTNGSGEAAKRSAYAVRDAVIRPRDSVARFIEANARIRSRLRASANDP
jgi:hypothetical protein